MCPPDRYKPPAVVPVANRGAARAGVARGYRHVALGGIDAIGRVNPIRERATRVASMTPSSAKRRLICKGGLGTHL